MSELLDTSRCASRTFAIRRVRSAPALHPPGKTADSNEANRSAEAAGVGP